LDNALISLADYQARAREILSGPQWDGLFSMPGDRMWRTNQQNAQAYDRWLVRGRVLSGFSTRELATTVLGQPVGLPVLIAPSYGPRGRAGRHGDGAEHCL